MDGKRSATNKLQTVDRLNFCSVIIEILLRKNFGITRCGSDWGGSIISFHGTEREGGREEDERRRNR